MPPKHGAKIKLGGRVRTLRYTLLAVEAAQDALGGDTTLVICEKLGELSFRHIHVMLWAGLLDDEPELTLGEAAKLIKPPAAPIVEAIMDGLEPWLEMPEEKGDTEAPKANRAARRSSGKRGQPA